MQSKDLRKQQIDANARGILLAHRGRISGARRAAARERMGA